MPDDVWFLIAVIGLIALLAGFVHSAIGFGYGIVAVALTPFVVDARSAHIIVSISSVPMLVMAAWAYREGVEKRSLMLALGGAALLLPAGLWLFETVSLDWLVRVTGFGILAMVLLSMRNQRTSDQSALSSPEACFVAGAASGFLAGAVSIAGPPIAAFALRQGWPPARFKSFVTQCLLVIAVYKASLLIGRGHFSGHVVWQTTAAAIVSIVGVQLGVLASRRVSSDTFRKLVAVALIIVSVLMITKGQSSREDKPAEATPAEVDS